jgi:predicted metal-dependent HD superfamily phosphohydrolase
MARGLHLRNFQMMAELRAIFRGGVRKGGADGLPPSWEALAKDFPAVELRWPGADERKLPSLLLPAAEWESTFFNFYELDGQLDILAERGGPFAVDILGGGEELPRTAREVLTRCQRWTDRRNDASRGDLFDRVLSRYRRRHDLAKPLVRADYNHALDTWQWALRLDPQVDLAVQLAALLHDVERLATEADRRIEHHAADYQAFKDGHAARGAELAEALLEAAGVDGGTRRRTARLIAAHEHAAAPGDPDAGAIALLNDADALSFFSLNSVGYLDYFGPEATRRKVAYTLRRLRPVARRNLGGVRLRPAVSAALAAELEALAA